MNVYKITDIIKCEFLKIPKAMFANPGYKKLSSDAKLTYAQKTRKKSRRVLIAQ